MTTSTKYPHGTLVNSEKVYFNFVEGLDSVFNPKWAHKHGATHSIWNPNENSGAFNPPSPVARPAKIHKTVVYVAIDEDNEGNPVWERWRVKHISTDKHMTPVEMVELEDKFDYRTCDRCLNIELPGDLHYLDSCGDLVCDYCYDNALEDGE